MNEHNICFELMGNQWDKKENYWLCNSYYYKILSLHVLQEGSSWYEDIKKG